MLQTFTGARSPCIVGRNDHYIVQGAIVRRSAPSFHKPFRHFTAPPAAIPVSDTIVIVVTACISVAAEPHVVCRRTCQYDDLLFPIFELVVFKSPLLTIPMIDKSTVGHPNILSRYDRNYALLARIGRERSRAPERCRSVHSWLGGYPYFPWWDASWRSHSLGR